MFLCFLSKTEKRTIDQDRSPKKKHKRKSLLFCKYKKPSIFSVLLPERFGIRLAPSAPLRDSPEFPESKGCVRHLGFLRSVLSFYWIPESVTPSADALHVTFPTAFDGTVFDSFAALRRQQDATYCTTRGFLCQATFRFFFFFRVFPHAFYFQNSVNKTSLFVP